MNRRNFFKLLAGTAAIAALGPKLLVAPKQTWVDIRFTAREAMMSLDHFEARILRPAIEAIAKSIDTDVRRHIDAMNDLKFYEGAQWRKEFVMRQHNVPIEFNSTRFG